jgi:hypothetical protein
MKLTDLNPVMLNSHIAFDCPMGHPHRIHIPVAERGWAMTGEFPTTVSLTPSIHAYTAIPHDDTLNHPDHKEEYDAASICGWHGYVTNGEMITV